MRLVTLRRSVGVFATTAVAVLCASCAGTGAPPPVGTSGVSVADPAGPAGVAPYVDVTLADVPLADMVTTTGVTGAVVAFGLATDGRCAPSWGGVRPLDDPAVTARITAFRGQGGAITVATGGADGEYLENACGTAAELAGAYTALVDATGAGRLDVDIETEVPADTVVAALRQVQQDRGVAVTLTLAVADTQRGLTRSALDDVQAAAATDLRFGVNAMVMNFPDDGDWRGAMLGAVAAVDGQLHTVWPGASDADIAARTGLTLMIGRTDTGPVTTLDDARAVAADAAARGITDLRLWSLARDNGDCPGAADARPDCSGLAQARFAFLTMFRDAVRAPETTTLPNGRNGS